MDTGGTHGHTPQIALAVLRTALLHLFPPCMRSVFGCANGRILVCDMPECKRILLPGSRVGQFVAVVSVQMRRTSHKKWPRNRGQVWEEREVRGSACQTMRSKAQKSETGQIAIAADAGRWSSAAGRSRRSGGRTGRWRRKPMEQSWTLSSPFLKAARIASIWDNLCIPDARTTALLAWQHFVIACSNADRIQYKRPPE